MTNLTELTQRVHKALVQDAYDTNDIVRLIDLSLNQQATLERLAKENEELTQTNARLIEALETAGKHIESLEAFSHLTQYSEETSK